MPKGQVLAGSNKALLGAERRNRTGARSQAWGSPMNVIASLSLKFNKFLHFTIEGNPVPTGADLWGISLGAMYGVVQGGASFSLPVPSFFTAQSRWILREFWGIDGNTRAGKRERTTGVESTSTANDVIKQYAWNWAYYFSVEYNKTAKHAQVIDVLEWLVHEGHRADPQYVAGNPEAAQDMLAWDLARAVMVARLALCAGYLSDAETLAYIRAAAIEAQQAFSSWEDYGRHYLKGLERWAGKPVRAYERAVDFLLKDPGSPWRRLDWHARLIHPEFEKVEKGPLGGLVYWRRVQGGKAVLMVLIAAMVTVILLGLQLKDNLSGPMGAHKTVVSKTADREFSDLNINFVASASKTIAVLVTSSESHPITEFRYGVDSQNPDKTMTVGRERENGRYPTSIYLPKGTRFLTLQVRFDDGSPSPVRRYAGSRFQVM